MWCSLCRTFILSRSYNYHESWWRIRSLMGPSLCCGLALQVDAEQLWCWSILLPGSGLLYQFRACLPFWRDLILQICYTSYLGIEGELPTKDHYVTAFSCVCIMLMPPLTVACCPEVRCIHTILHILASLWQHSATHVLIRTSWWQISTIIQAPLLPSSFRTTVALLSMYVAGVQLWCFGWGCIPSGMIICV